MPYIGKSPELGVRTRYYYTVSAGATSVSGNDDNSKSLIFSDGEYVDVYLNGVSLVAGTDYNTTTANTIAGLSAMSANDVVEVIVYDVFSVFSGDISGDLDVGGTVTVNNIIQTTTSDGDMVFKGNDGGSTITALTLDMSEAGAATFNSGITLGSSLTASGAPFTISNTSNGNNIDIKTTSGGSLVHALKIHSGGLFEAKQGAVFNEDSNDVDFRVESNDDANMFVVNAGSNVVLVGHDTSVDSDGVVADFQNHSTTHGAISTHRYSANASAPQIIIGKSRSGSLGGNTVLQSGDYCGILGWHGNDGNGFHEAGQIAVIVQSGVGNDDVPADMVFQTNSGGTGTTERFRIAANGDLTATDTSIGSNSDERLKKDIADFSYDLETFKKYKVRKFNWKQPDLHMNKTNQMGFVAQELQDVDSQWVSTTTLHSNNKGEAHPEAQYVNSDLSAFTAKLGEKDAMYISIIQQLTTKIETLETKVKALEDA
jgi:hypothetical protein